MCVTHTTGTLYPAAQTSLVSCLPHFLMSDNRIETGGTHDYSHWLRGPRVSSDYPATASGFDLSVSDNRAMLHVGVNINYFSELQSQTSLRNGRERYFRENPIGIF